MGNQNMEIKEFCEKIKEGLETFPGKEVTVTIHKIAKNNGIVLNSVVIAEKCRNISPNIYLDDLYQEYGKGKEMKAIVEEVMDIYKSSMRRKNMDMDFFLDYEKLRKRVAYKIIGRERNEELLKEIPHIIFLNLAIVFYCCVPEGELDRATILIYNNHLQMWGISEEKLFEDARANTIKILPPRLLSLEKMMEEVFVRDLKKEFKVNTDNQDEFIPDEEWFDRAAKQMLSSVTNCNECGGMFVLGNEYKLFGAAVILYDGVLKAFADKLSSDIFILPSSIHEVILIPDDGGQEAENLWRMVCDINATQVDPEEVLTDSVYYFSRINNKINKLF